MPKTSTKKAAPKVSKSKIVEAFIEHVLTEGRRPGSVFLFAKSLKIREEEFYKHFNSFEVLEKQLWNGWLEETIQVITADKQYQQYSVREKILALFFTWIEILKSNRSYTLVQFEKVDRRDVFPDFLKSTKGTFEAFFRELMVEGIESDEIVDRKPISNQYEKAFWAQFIFITRFWIHDESQDFEKTDAFIEKSVHFAFDVAGRGVIDSFLDLSKFLAQNMRPF